ncbi:Eco57I restriction-modification methylase domain-containing protein [Nesterenkonia ebinurensis]|uniref:Eco57I restriction-modification methylase domain-containing protein n=1 Tax=Nesterenkonia ebinurensis TaxID=2608252 RepID=UPI001CC34572|nr:N-6 DNA methylase [Nesterenkonia ebinurensis]
MSSTAELGGLCRALLPSDLPALSAGENILLESADAPATGVVEQVRGLVLAGADPLGDIFCRLHSAELRRGQGQTYTPQPIVDAMVDWAAHQGMPARVVDPGAGSGRYTIAAGLRFPATELIAVELDPLSALILRTNLHLHGLSSRTQVVVGDYRELELPETAGRTLFIGNPPYVRHHGISGEWKEWLRSTAAHHGLRASALAGLHVHFYLATAQLGRPGDYGAFVTSAEWLDVNYGSVVRELLTNGLGGQTIHLLDPDAAPFPDTATTAAIVGFELGSSPRSLTMKHVKDLHSLGRLSEGTQVDRQRLLSRDRWSTLTTDADPGPEGYVELGELCRVHRGAVTGANKFWVEPSAEFGLPEHVLMPSVTRARELFSAGRDLSTEAMLKRVAELPADLDALDMRDRRLIARFLREGQRLGVHQGYIASMRKPWWRVQLRSPAPILATYMARRPPTFVRNTAEARHINIAHGLYPREPLSDDALGHLAAFLRSSTSLTAGRTYAGGLTKFEPREMERILVPTPEHLAAAVEVLAG